MPNKDNYPEPDKIIKDTESSEMSFDGLVGLFEQTQAAMQNQAARSVDIALVVRNWLFGWYIVEFEKSGSSRKELYGKELMPKLSKRLTDKLGKGFSRRSLDQFRQFYEIYHKIWQTLSAKFSLSWSHYVVLLTIKSLDERRIYAICG